MTEKSLVVMENNGIQCTKAQYELVVNTVAKGATDEEADLYFHDCSRRGVHPLDGLIHFSVHTSGGVRKYTPLVSIDYMRIRAESSGVYAGSDDAIFSDKKDSTWSATVTVWKVVGGIRCPFTATARWSEYFPGETKGFMWKKMPHCMLAKCAEGLALRKAFPGQLSGLYAREEMDQAGGPIVDAPVPGADKEVKEIDAILNDDPEPSEEDFQKTMDEKGIF